MDFAARDFLNPNIVFTVRAVTEHTPIAALPRDHDSVDVLELAGATQVLELADMPGRSLARRTLGRDTRANAIGQYGALVIAEAPVFGTPLAGQRLADSRLAQATGLTVLGVCARGTFTLVGPETRLAPSSVLVLAGSEAQLAAFDELMVIYDRPDEATDILGAGRLGRAAAHDLAGRGAPYRTVERAAVPRAVLPAQPPVSRRAPLGRGRDRTPWDRAWPVARSSSHAEHVRHV